MSMLNTRMLRPLRMILRREREDIIGSGAPIVESLTSVSEMHREAMRDIASSTDEREPKGVKERCWKP